MREPHRLLGKKAMDNELLRKAVCRAGSKKYDPPRAQGNFECHEFWGVGHKLVGRGAEVGAARSANLFGMA